MPHLAEYADTLVLSPYNAPPPILDARTGAIAPNPSRRKVAIVGAGHGKNGAPLTDDTWEVWALNACPVIDHVGRLRADRWFELHVRAAQNENDMRWIKACPFPLYLPPAWATTVLDARDRGEEHEDVPMAVAYPLKQVETWAGTSYFTCTFAYQIALALMEGFTTIGLYGVELAFGTMRERTVEWACVSYWLGLARGMGIEVLRPANTRLGRHSYRYGIEYYEEKQDVERYLDMMHRADEGRDALGMGG